jgi:RNA polymerase sigma-70 factor (ECF subfamily)
MYTQAHLVPGGNAATDRDVADDAVWLARVVSDALPAEPEARGLLALLLFHRARDDARDNDGDLVLLDDQDRAAWDQALLAEGRAQLERCAADRRPGRFQLQAAIAACHADAAAPADTDWLQILTLYDVLVRWDASPVVRLNRAVAVARVEGPAAALVEVDALRDSLAGFHLWHAVRAEMLRGLGRDREATDADLQALELTANEAERRLLAARAGL